MKQFNMFLAEKGPYLGKVSADAGPYLEELRSQDRVTITLKEKSAAIGRYIVFSKNCLISLRRGECWGGRSYRREFIIGLSGLETDFFPMQIGNPSFTGRLYYYKHIQDDQIISEFDAFKMIDNLRNGFDHNKDIREALGL